MDEIALRLVVAVGIGAAAAIAAVVSRRGRAWRRRPFDPRGLGPGIHLFSSRDCRSCRKARSVIEAAGLAFEEHTYESEAELLDNNGVDRVPTIARVAATGERGWIAEGIPTRRSLVRWMGP